MPLCLDTLLKFRCKLNKKSVQRSVLPVMKALTFESRYFSLAVWLSLKKVKEEDKVMLVKGHAIKITLNFSLCFKGRTNVLSIRIGDTETRFVLNWCFLETIALRMEWWTFLWVREGGGAYGKAICFLSDKKWTNRCLLWKTNGIFSCILLIGFLI